MLLTLNSEPKSPYTRHTIEFIAKYLQSFSIPKEVLKESNSGSDSDTTVIDEQVAAEYDTSADKSPTDENRRPSDDCQDSEECDELGIESFGSESFITGRSRDSRVDSMMTTTMMSKDETNETELTFLDIFVKEKLIRYLNNSKTHIRYNCCFLIRKLFTDLEDIDFDVYKKLKKV